MKHFKRILSLLFVLVFLSACGARAADATPFALQFENPYAPQAPNDFAASPLTLAIFGLLAGYYVTYAIGLINWRKRVEQSPAFKT